MNENEHDCPTCADWDKTTHCCTAVLHGGTPCVDWRPRPEQFVEDVNKITLQNVPHYEPPKTRNEKHVKRLKRAVVHREFKLKGHGRK